MQQPYQSYRQKRPIRFAALTVIGVLALLLGLALIVYENYHERAYVFLGMGAACFIGGIAGIIIARPKGKAALSYGAIALGIMGVLVGLNYLTGRYGGEAPNATRAAIVIAPSIVAILGGIGGALMLQPRGRLAALSSAILLGVIASFGIVALIAGAVYLLVFEHHGHAYTLLGAGAICLIGGIASGTLVQRKARTTAR